MSLPLHCPCCSKGAGAHPWTPSTHELLQRGKEKQPFPAPWDSEQKAVEGSQTARASPAAPFLLTQFPVGSMHYCFLLSHLQHPDRKKDFSPCFADCRGHSLLPGGWSCAGKGHPITRVCSAPVPRARTCGESGASTASSCTLQHTRTAPPALPKLFSPEEQGATWLPSHKAAQDAGIISRGKANLAP